MSGQWEPFLELATPQFLLSSYVSMAGTCKVTEKHQTCKDRWDLTPSSEQDIQWIFCSYSRDTVLQQFRHINFLLILGKCHGSVCNSLQFFRVCLGCSVSLAVQKGRTEVTCSGFSPPLTYTCIFYVLIVSSSSFHEGYGKFQLNNWSRIKCPMCNFTWKCKMNGKFEGRLWFFSI